MIYIIAASGVLIFAVLLAGAALYRASFKKRGSAAGLRKLPLFFAQEHPVLSYLALYTLLFWFLFTLIFAVLILTGRGMIWKDDGFPQYFPYLRYLGKYLREMILEFLGGNFLVKMYDFTIGMGADVRTVVQTHPLELLSVLVPARYTELFYNALVMLRFYLAGLSYSLFCRYRRIPWKNAMLTSFVYIFCGYSLVKGTAHLMFNSPLILFPLLLLSLDLLIQKKKKLLFTLIVGISMANNFYFLYMMTFAMGVYALLVFPEYYKESRLKEFAGMMGRIIFYYVLGCGLAAVSVLPTLIRLFSGSRVGTTSTIRLFYDGYRAALLFLSTISAYTGAGYTSYLNYAVPVLPLLAMFLVRRKKEYWKLKIALFLEAAALLLPFCGYLLSGLGNITNRWTFIISFTVAIAMARAIEDLNAPTRLQKFAAAAMPVLYGIGVCISIIKGKQTVDNLLAFFLLVVFTVPFLFFLCARRVNRRQLMRFLCGFTALSLVVHGWVIYSSYARNYASEFMENEEADSKIDSSAYVNYQKLPEDGFYRVDNNLMSASYENIPMELGYNGVSIYNSVIPSSLLSWHTELENTGISGVIRIWTLDGRSALETLSCVRYYMVKAGQDAYVPYGFTKSESLSDDSYWIYENENMLPIGYTYRTVSSRSDYESLSALGKQELMLESAVLDDADCETVLTGSSISASTADPEADILQDTPALTADEGVSLTDGSCTIENSGSGFTLSYEKKPGYEIYLRISGLDREKAYVNVSVRTADVKKTIIMRGRNQTYSLERSDYLVKLGYCTESGSDTIHVTFGKSGTYELGSVEVYYVPMEGYEEKIASLGEEALENVSVGTNTVSGTVSLSEDRFMVFAIPWSSGWKAYVDGEEVSLCQANTAFMGISLTKGDHEIVLRYTTPGLPAGAAFSLASFVILLLLFAHGRRKRLRGLQSHSCKES